jgi:AmmeMemoRadiSam system protein A
MPEKLNAQERTILLRIARQAITSVVQKQPLEKIDLNALPESMRLKGASFVTLTTKGNLRGCIGALEAYQPLALDVQEHAIAAAIQDYRFQPVQESELAEIQIEISRLTAPEKLDYNDPEELIQQLCPKIDGVILSDSHHRATFLPQVWEKLPDPTIFLSQLCLKMGASPNLWKRQHLEVLTYQVEEFHEA